LISFKSPWNKEDWSAFSSADIIITSLQVGSEKKFESRDLTYFGKNLIIKSFVLSVIGYEIEMRGIPVKFEKEINSIIWDFIWDGYLNSEIQTSNLRDSDNILKSSLVQYL
jgi:hypothetical protein